jgi:small neutral amino acid transporter SnatA (MarC family)
VDGILDASAFTSARIAGLLLSAIAVQLVADAVHSFVLAYR